MNFLDPLISGKLVKRYKRFMADVTLENGDIVTAHCANTGAMIGVQEPGSEVWLSPARNPNRKLKYTWELVRVGGGLVGINTAHPNTIVAEAIESEKIPELAGYGAIRREVKYGENSRIDILLSGEGKPDCYVEIKNVHLMRNRGVAEFPDSVSTRAAKHQNELKNMVQQGARAMTVYLCQREDCDTFRLADDIDPNYAEAVGIAKKHGVEAVCYDCILTPKSINIGKSMKIIL